MSTDLVPVDVAESAPAIRDIRSVDDPPGVENPYWEAVRQLPDSRLSFYDDGWSPEGFGIGFKTYEKIGPSRDELVHRYAWAISDPLSVGFVAGHCPNGVIEIGAGSGYWAWQLAQRGVSVAAVDEAPPNMAKNWYCQNYESHADYDQSPGKFRPLFHPVTQSNTRAARDFPERVLFLCWPPYGSPMAAAALDFYTGNRLIYIGEGDGGCCADDDFFARLSKGWVEVATHRPVQWGGLSDWITVYDRAGAR